MLKIAKSIMMIAVMGFVAIGVTQSYFTDTETIADNVMTFGTLDMTIGDETYAPISLDNVRPGDVIQKNITINNAGSLDFGSLKMSLIGTNDPSGLLDQFQVTSKVIVAEVAGSESQSVASGIIDLELLDEGNQIAAGSQAVVELYITIPAELGNEYQAQGVSFDLIFNAEQVIE